MSLQQNIKIAVDAIVFGYSQHQLHVLLVKQKYGHLKNKWVIAGGFVKDDETLTHAVKRELKEEAGITVDYMEQLYTFGDDIHRDPRFRVITVAYFALVNPAKLKLVADTDAEEARWFPMNEVPKLGFDHNDILKVAIKRLKDKLTYQPIGFDLLPKEFPFSDLENLYCSILETEIDRRNFRKKVLSFGLVEETEKYATKKEGRPAKLYRFNRQKYQQFVKEGYHFEIK